MNRNQLSATKPTIQRTVTSASLIYLRLPCLARRPLRRPRAQTLECRLGECPEAAIDDRTARLSAQLEQEMHVVERQEAQAEQLVLRDEVADVGAREAYAGRARAAVLERALVAREAGVAEVEPPVPGGRRARAAEARRQHAVEHVDARADHAQDALGI